MDACHAILRSNIIYAAGLLTTQFTIGKYFQLTKNAISAKMTNWPVRAAVEFSEMRIRQVENEMRMRPTFHLNIDTADTNTDTCLCFPRLQQYCIHISTMFHAFCFISGALKQESLL